MPPAQVELITSLVEKQLHTNQLRSVFCSRLFPHAGRRLPLIGILKIAFYDEAIGMLARGFSKRIELGDIIPLQFILLVQATRRSLIRENESAELLAQNGFKVEQNPVIAGPKEPDYRINGEIFDNYAPSTSNARNIASEIARKITNGQTERVVVNLADSSVSPAALEAQLTAYAIPGLKQAIIIDRSGGFKIIKFGE